jgi:hypothetical protein
LVVSLGTPLARRAALPSRCPEPSGFREWLVEEQLFFDAGDLEVVV